MNDWLVWIIAAPPGLLLGNWIADLIEKHDR